MYFFNPIARPFGSLLMFFYEILDRFGIANFGLSIILLAVLLKLILLPFQMKSKKGTLRQARLQPKIAELQKKYGSNKQKIQEEQMKLYKEYRVNPASGCIWGLIPMPILFAMFQVIRQPIVIIMGVARDVYSVLHGITGDLETSVFYLLGAPERVADPGFHAQMAQSQWINEFGIQNFIDRASELDIVRNSQVVLEHGMDYFISQLENLQYINYTFLGLNLSINPQWNFLWDSFLNPDIYTYVYTSWLAGFGLFLIPLFSAGAQFLSMRINRKFQPQPAGVAEGQGKTMQTVMNFMPLVSVWFGFMMPGAFGFYWTLSSGLQTAQDVWLNKTYVKKLDAEEAVFHAEREAREAELEAKRLETERLKAEGLIEQNKNTSKRKKQKTSKQEQREKAAEWEKKNKPEKNKPKGNEPSRVDNRRYARGRAYVADRYDNEDTSADSEGKDYDEHEEYADAANLDDNAEYEYEDEYDEYDDDSDYDSDDDDK